MSVNTDLLEALPVAVYTTDAEGRITFYNQAAAELWGCRPELGKNQWCGSWRLYWPDGRPMAHDQCPMAVALREGEAVRGEEAIAERPDGTRVPFQPYPTPLKDASGRVIGGINLLVDISASKEAELQSQRLAAIVTSSDDAIISKTLAGRVTSWNRGAARIFGYEAAEMIGQPINRIIPPELQHEETEILARLSRGEHIDHYETERVAKDGRRIDISLTVSPLRDGAGRVIGASKVARDISGRKRAEKLQRLLVEELNHRVKNTLATIQAIASQSLRRAKSPGDFVASFTGRIQALAKAHTLLTQTRLEGAYLIDLVREQVLLGVPDNRITPSGPQLMLDSQSAVQLALVLHELATNARKYGALSTSNGRLSVEWEVRTNGKKELVLDWIESGGPPVHAPSNQGFGTTLIKQTLQSRGGEASLRFGAEGVTCRITLPLPVEQSPISALLEPLSETGNVRQVNPHAGRFPLEGRRVLVIEDAPLISMDIETTLNEVGCKVIGPAGTIDQARDLIGATKLDAALVDVNLAGQSVEELASALTGKGVPFAFVTGYGRDALPQQFRGAAMLSKPFQSKELIATVERLIGGRSQSSASVLQFNRRGG
jgi:PAS domain S-box-containing protein